MADEIAATRSAILGALTQHHVTGYRSRVEDPCYRIQCACGWQAAWAYTIASGHVLFREHQADAVMEATDG